MTIEEITIRKEGQIFDCKNIQIVPKALAITIIVVGLMLKKGRNRK